MSIKDPYGPRQRRLVQAMKRKGLDALLVEDRANTHYLSGFRGSASIICMTVDQGYFLTDFRYITVARASVPHLKIVMARTNEPSRLAKILKRHKVKRIGFEGTVQYRQYKRWRDSFDGAELVESSGLLTHLRECKTRDEWRRMERAQAIAERSLARVLEECKPGVTEKALERRLLHAFEDEGAEGPSFPPIIASGPNAALPHAVPGERRLKKGDFVIFDLGALVEGYASDMTRTVVLGRASDRQREVYQTVLEAQRRAISRVRPGAKAKTLDKAARSWIEKAGHGKRFGHGLGHGVGLEVHETPFMGPNSKDVLRPGMVVTVEPGIYIKGWGGVRIEDMVLVKRNGRQILGSFPKHLMELDD